MVDCVFRTKASDLPNWKQSLNLAVERDISKAIDEIVQDASKIESVVDEFGGVKFLYGDWEWIDDQTLIIAYTRIRAAHGNEIASNFIKLLEDSEVVCSDVVDGWLSELLLNPYYNPYAVGDLEMKGAALEEECIDAYSYESVEDINIEEYEASVLGGSDDDLGGICCIL